MQTSGPGCSCPFFSAFTCTPPLRGWNAHTNERCHWQSTTGTVQNLTNFHRGMSGQRRCSTYDIAYDTHERESQCFSMPRYSVGDSVETFVQETTSHPRRSISKSMERKANCFWLDVGPVHSICRPVCRVQFTRLFHSRESKPRLSLLQCRRIALQQGWCIHDKSSGINSDEC